MIVITARRIVPSAWKRLLAAAATALCLVIAAGACSNDSPVSPASPTVCMMTVTPTSLSFGSGGGGATITVMSSTVPCPWNPRSNDAFIAVTAGTTGVGNGSVAISVSGNPGAARTGSVTIGTTTVTIGQDGAPLASVPVNMAVYDATFKVPVCDGVGRACDSGTLLNSSGPGEPNQPNTLFNSCIDGQGTGHLGRVDSIRVETLDGGALSINTSVRITYVAGSTSASAQQVYIASNPLNPVWTVVGGGPFGGTHTLNTVLPGVSGLVAIRILGKFGGSFVAGPCITGTDDDADDLVFRIK
jgi:hypothetical protein